MYDAPFVPECVPRVLIFPRVSAASISTLTPLDDTAALLELVPNVLLTEPRSSQRHLDALASLVAVCTCYRLETGRDFDRIGELVRGLLA